MSHEETQFKRFKEGAWVVVWRWGVVGLGMFLSGFSMYAMLWLKVNAPTRIEFNDLVKTVQMLREDLIRRENLQWQLTDHERRILKLEGDSDERRRQQKP